MKLTTQEHKEIAGEILRQLGGRCFIAMTGAHSFYTLGSSPFGGMSLKFKGSTKANCIKVILEASDTYTFEFYRLTKDFERSMKPVKVFENVYNDMLQDIFTSVTGLETSLGTMKG